MQSYNPPQPGQGISDNPYCNDPDCNEPTSRAMRWHTEVCAMIRGEIAMPVTWPTGMLPDALLPVADEWYRLCERRHYVDRMTISGKLAEAIVEAVCDDSQKVSKSCAHEWRTAGGGGESRRPLVCSKCNQHRDHMPQQVGEVYGDVHLLVAKWRKIGDGEIGDAYSGPYYDCAKELEAALAATGKQRVGEAVLYQVRQEIVREDSLGSSNGIVKERLNAWRDISKLHYEAYLSVMGGCGPTGVLGQPDGPVALELNQYAPKTEVRALYAAPPAQAVDQPNEPGRTLFLDLDGVMADFDLHFYQCFGQHCRELDDEIMWPLIYGHHTPFFRSMPPMPGALEFFKQIEHLNPVILTACPKTNYAAVAEQKRAWVREHLSKTCMVLPVLGSHNKPLFMHQPGDVLIDDYGKNCRAWAAAGGNAIKHEGYWHNTLLDTLHHMGVLHVS